MSELFEFGRIVLLVAAGFSLALASSKLTERFPLPGPAIFLLAAALASDLFPALANHTSIRQVERIGVVALIAILFDVKQAHELVELDLDESFFQVRIGRATKAELAYLSAMAHLGSGPYRSGEIAAKLGRPGPEGVAPTRAHLIEKGLIYSPSYGLNEFTVPQFDAFIRRSFPLRKAAPRSR